MAYYVINETTLPVRVLAWRIKDERRIMLLLTTYDTKAPHAALDVTLRKGIHKKACVPGVHEGIKVTIENRAGVTTKVIKTAKGDRILFIKSILN